MIEKILPGNKTKFRILENIYPSSGINLTALIKKTHASPNLVLSYVNLLLSYDVVKEERLGGKKKTHIRIIKPNFGNELSLVLYSLIEMNKAEMFFQKYKSLKPIFLQLRDLLNTRKGFALLYGSFARFGADKDSDIDLIIVSSIKKEDITKIREIFITHDNELSLKIETLNKFISNKDKPLYQNILKDHVVIYGVNEYVSALMELY